MTGKKEQELLSALVDGETRGNELDEALTWLKQSPEARARWSRYHLLHDVIHNNLPPQSDLRLHERVARALEDEPVVLAPRRLGRHLPRLSKQAAGVAIAASVAAVAILTYQDRGEAPVGGAETTAVASVAAPAPGPVYNVSSVARAPVQAQSPLPVQRVAGTDPLAQPMIRDERLDAYLANHSEYSASSSMQGMLPYVRIVSQQGEK